MLRTITSMAIAALFVPLVMTTKAQATDRYALVCVHNTTNQALTYSFRWGSANWRQITLAANSVEFHSWSYQYGSAPRMEVSFDSVLPSFFSSEKPYPLRYTLTPLPAPEQNCTAYGNDYNFVFDGVSRSHIDLIKAPLLIPPLINP